VSKSFNQEVIDKVLLKIEENLTYTNIEELIAYSGFSYYHFHRLFVAYVGETLARYIKRIRLEKAAFQLNFNRLPITEVAMEAGYNTPSAFNKAFKEFFGLNPSEFKKQQHRVQEYTIMEPKRIETIDPIKVYAVRHVGDYSNTGDAWGVLMGFSYTHKMKHKRNLLGKEASIYGVSYDDPSLTEPSKCRYDACLSADDDVEPSEGVERKAIAGGKYAIFLHKGSYDQLDQSYSEAFAWIKSNGISLRDVPAFDRYLNRDPRRTKPENLKTEIYIPIQ
jgi:AraC family transcriptional regulator